jgi:hypothetical protein
MTSTSASVAVYAPEIAPQKQSKWSTLTAKEDHCFILTNASSATNALKAARETP